MPTKLIPWSHSRINTFDTCPHRFNHEYVLQDVQDTDTHPAAAYGLEVHKAIEDALNDHVALPDDMAPFAPWVTAAASLPNVRAEVKMAINHKWEACDFYADDAWGRAIADVLSVHGNSAAVVDWKLGKYRGKTRQASINALMVFAAHPEVEYVHTRFIYMRAGKTDADKFTRDQVPELREYVAFKSSLIEACNTRRSWPLQPSGLCGYCPVKDCPEHK